MFLKETSMNDSRFLRRGMGVLALPGILLAVTAAMPLATAFADPKPNIVIIYSDDIGYGDLSSYGAELIQTPKLDQLAAGGARFTSGYCMASTCTPSRYSLMTGEYAFRNPDAEILAGNSGAIIQPGTPTIASVLQDAGYRTGVIGKWHLGAGDGNPDWNEEITPTPLDIGFDVSFIIPGTNDRVPTVWLDGTRVHNWSEDDDPIRVSYGEQVGDLPTGTSHPELLRYAADGQHSGTIVNGISRIGWMDGGQSAWWDDEMMAFDILERSQNFVRESRDQPFFLFMSMHENHVPRAPHPDFVGRSDTGLRGDAVVELDHVVGELMSTLEELGLKENTLVVFSSDNGPIFFDGYYDGAIEHANDHAAAGPFRGGKYQVYEAATRVPTIVHWPARVEAGTVSDAIVSQVDLLRSLAALVGAEVPEGAARDSQNQLAAWLGEANEGRDYVIQQGIRALAIRRGDWKLIPANQDVPAWVDRKHNQYENPLSGPLPAPDRHALFNLAEDPRESNNLAEKYPEKVEELYTLLNELRDGPRSRF